jgi:GxxExxY protein
MEDDKHRNENALIFKDEVYHIVGAAMNVSNTLGCGFLEPVYQECLEIEFSNNKIPFESQKHIQIFYKDKVLTKEYIADFLCYDKIILEIKAIRKITDIEEAQLMNYLRATKLPLGLIINFGGKKMEWRRYANTKDPREENRE